jgi:hypothetical protein
MKQWIEFPLEDGGSIMVEADVPEEAGIVPAARGEEVVQRAQQTFEVALEKVRPAAQAIIKKLRTLHDAPDEITVEFGLKLSAEAGAIIAAGGVEANYKVALRWKKSVAQVAQD